MVIKLEGEWCGGSGIYNDILVLLMLLMRCKAIINIKYTLNLAKYISTVYYVNRYSFI